MNKFKIWLIAIRPQTLGASLAPVVLGTAFSEPSTHLAPPVYGAVALSCLAGALSLQILANLVNDYMDHIKGVDTAARLGPKRVCEAGLVSPVEIKTAIGIVTLVAALIGGWLTWLGGLPIAIITITSLWCAYLYTAGPYPLGYNGLGDVFAFIFFGPVAVLGVVYLLHLEYFSAVFGGKLMIIAIIPGLFSTCLISVNNLRDRQGDAQRGKRTLAVILGGNFVKWEYAVITISIYLLALINIYYFKAPFTTLAGLLIFPFSLRLVRRIFCEDGQALNLVLADTAKSMVLFCFIYSLGLVIS